MTQTIKISALGTASTPLTGAEMIPLVQSGVTKRVASSNFLDVTAANSTTSRSLVARFGNMLSVKDFGAVGDGTTDDTTAINAANVAATAAGQPLYWPAGTYIATNIPTIANMVWYGAGMDLTTIKLKTNTNGTLVSTATPNSDNVCISDMTFDGNASYNTGVTLPLVQIIGHKPELTNLRFLYAAGTALTTDYDIDIYWVGGALGRFKNLIFDTIQGHGWVHRGPNDSSLLDIYMVDIGLAANNTYDGLRMLATAYTAGGGNSRISSFHHNNRDGATNTPRAGCYIDAGVSGVTFTNCHFEGGNTPLLVEGAVNTFASCIAYAPRGDYAIKFIGGGNLFQGAILNYGASANPAFKGILLASPQNIIDIFTSGPTEGSIDFTGSGGLNIVRMVGNTLAATPLYVGTPAASDEVYMHVDHTDAGTEGFFIQNVGYEWTAYTPTITSGGGAVTGETITKAGRYKLIGKTLFIEFTITLTNIGGGVPTGAVYASLPSGLFIKAKSAAGCLDFNGVISGSMFADTSASTIGFVKYDGTTYWSNGTVLVGSASFEIL